MSKRKQFRNIPRAHGPSRREGDKPLRPHGKTERHTTRPERQKKGAVGIWLYGTHAVLAALANPKRQINRLLANESVLETIGGKIETLGDGRPGAGISPEIAGRNELDDLFPADTVHQGLALLVQPLDPPDLEDIIEMLAPTGKGLLILLDQVSDPRNVGAVLRSAAAFGASAVILPERHAPLESGALAKAASGALEAVPLIRVTNVARTLESLKSGGFWCIGLDPSGGGPLKAPTPPVPVALVLGAEGHGMRRLTLERCDEAMRIPLQGTVESLNLSAAAAIALYEFRTCAA